MMRTLSCDLIEWFKLHRRDLPWRRDPSLYKTVVSEFMLQQTQVTTVLPYFENWMTLFPDFFSLANAEEAAVLKAWEGLGYYSRARSLHALAKTIAQLKEIPTDAASWERFKGIGPYTAAAITSIAFSHPAAVVDGNVIRILTRLQADETVYPSNQAAFNALRPLAQSLLDLNNPSTHNEALMELGATVCTKHNPLCTVCPIFTHCKSGPSGQAGQLPRLVRKGTTSRTLERFWIQSPFGLLLSKAHSKAKRLANLYELPDLQELGLMEVPQDAQLLTQQTRGIASERIKELFYTLDNFALHPPLPHLHWISFEDLARVTLSGPHRRIVNQQLAAVCGLNGCKPVE